MPGGVSKEKIIQVVQKEQKRPHVEDDPCQGNGKGIEYERRTPGTERESSIGEELTQPLETE